MGTPQPRRSDTRRRIQDVALDLFAEQGYEKTSLREIAEHLDVTKAALYYHFKTKEDILQSIVDDLSKPIDDVLDWAKQQPRTLGTKIETLKRYSIALTGGTRLFRFLQENQATVRDLSIGEQFRDRMFALRDLLTEPDAALPDQVRCMTALFTMHAGMFVMKDIDADPEAKRAAILDVAIDLVRDAHPARN